MNLAIFHQALSNANRTAIIDQKGQYSYIQLLEKATNIAAYLLRNKDDLQEARIAVIDEGGLDFVAAIWGVWMAGGIAVPLCLAHPEASLHYTLENAEVSLVLYHANYKSKIASLATTLEINTQDINAIGDKDIIAAYPELSSNRGALMLYTSGTTSKPKGVVITHGNIESQIKTLTTAWHWQQDDHILNILPLHHVHGLINITHCALWMGACCEFLPKFDAQKVWSRFGDGDLTLFMAVPTVYYKLIDHYNNKITDEEKEALNDSLKSFRLMVSGSAALPISVLEKWQKITGQRLLERYGMTEIGMAVSNPYLEERRAGHIGQPLPNVQLRLVNDTGVVIQDENVSGEIQIKSPNVFREYWKRPKATAESFTEDGWFKTGDIALLDNGYYRILGRNSVDIIKSGGYKISALEIEEVLRKHPSIKDCAVVGIPNEEWGEIIGAALVTSDTVDIEALKTWLKPFLAAYKLPRLFLTLEDLPRNILGKVTKPAIKPLFD